MLLAVRVTLCRGQCLVTVVLERPPSRYEEAPPPTHRVTGIMVWFSAPPAAETPLQPRAAPRSSVARRGCIAVALAGTCAALMFAGQQLDVLGRSSSSSSSKHYSSPAMPYGQPYPVPITPVSYSLSTMAKSVDDDLLISHRIEFLHHQLDAAKSLNLNSRGQAKILGVMNELNRLEKSRLPQAVAGGAAPPVAMPAVSKETAERIQFLRRNVEAAAGLELNNKGKGKLDLVKAELAQLEQQSAKVQAQAQAQAAQLMAAGQAAQVQAAQQRQFAATTGFQPGVADSQKAPGVDVLDRIRVLRSNIDAVVGMSLDVKGASTLAAVQAELAELERVRFDGPGAAAAPQVVTTTVDPAAQMISDIRGRVDTFGSEKPGMSPEIARIGMNAGLELNAGSPIPTTGSVTDRMIGFLRRNIDAARGKHLNPKGQAKLDFAIKELATLERAGSANDQHNSAIESPVVMTAQPLYDFGAPATSLTLSEKNLATSAFARITVLRARVSAVKGKRLNGKGLEKLQSVQAELAGLERMELASLEGGVSLSDSMKMAPEPPIGTTADESVRAAVASVTGSHWMPSVSGVNFADPSSVLRRIHHLRVDIESVRGKTLNKKGQTKLASVQEELAQLERLGGTPRDIFSMMMHRSDAETPMALAESTKTQEERSVTSAALKRITHLRHQLEAGVMNREQLVAVRAELVKIEMEQTFVAADEGGVSLPSVQKEVATPAEVLDRDLSRAQVDDMQMNNDVEALHALERQTGPASPSEPVQAALAPPSLPLTAKQGMYYQPQFAAPPPQAAPAADLASALTSALGPYMQGQGQAPDRVLAYRPQPPPVLLSASAKEQESIFSSEDFGGGSQRMMELWNDQTASFQKFHDTQAAHSSSYGTNLLSDEDIFDKGDTEVPDLGNNGKKQQHLNLPDEAALITATQFELTDFEPVANMNLGEDSQAMLRGDHVSAPESTKEVSWAPKGLFGPEESDFSVSDFVDGPEAAAAPEAEPEKKEDGADLQKKEISFYSPPTVSTSQANYVGYNDHSKKKDLNPNMLYPGLNHAEDKVADTGKSATDFSPAVPETSKSIDIKLKQSISESIQIAQAARAKTDELEVRTTPHERIRPL